MVLHIWWKLYLKLTSRKLHPYSLPLKSLYMDIVMLDIKFICNHHITDTKVDGVQQRRLLPIIASCAIFAAASPLVP